MKKNNIDTTSKVNHVNRLETPITKPNQNQNQN